jgi:hypothetical protein
MNTLLVILVITIIYEISVMILRKIRRRITFAHAKARAKQTGKKLLVIGDPYNGIASKTTGLDYSCGDVCVDLTGCPKCPESIKGRLEDTIGSINLNDYVIYISCVLEYTDDLPKILRYLDTVDKSDIFVVNVEWYSLMAWFYPYFLTNERPPQNIKMPNGKYIKNPLT